MAETILIIEDDPALLRVLADNFKFEGYMVETAANGKRGLEAALKSKAALILLDLMLPEVDGFEICRQLRRAGLTTPVIMLTAKGQESDIVRGLNLGADDYVTKPFSIHVLLARVQAYLRRRQAHAPAVMQFGSYRFDTTAHKLFRGEREMTLTPKEFRLREFFV